MYRCNENCPRPKIRSSTGRVTITERITNDDEDDDFDRRSFTRGVCSRTNKTVFFLSRGSFVRSFVRSFVVSLHVSHAIGEPQSRSDRKRLA